MACPQKIKFINNKANRIDMVLTEKKSILLDGLLFSIYVFVILFITILGLFLFKGAEKIDLFEKANFYYTVAGFSLLAIFALMTLEYLVAIRFFSYKTFGWAKVFIHNVDEGFLYRLAPIRKYLTLGNIIHISIIFSLIAGFYSVTTNTFFTSLPSTEFQVTKTGQMILAAEPAASSETLLVITALSLIIGFSLWLIRRSKLPSATEQLLYFLVPIISMFIWIGIHYFRYGGTETSLFAVAIFGLLGGALTIAFGSVIPWYIWHLFNNIFLKAKELFASETLIIFIVIFIIVYLMAVFGWKYYSRKKV